VRTADWGGKLRVQTAVLLFAAACLSGCGGGVRLFRLPHVRRRLPLPLSDHLSC
jgi:hypothetical protein